MSPKIEKTVREIEQTKAKITELQALLPELERQKTDLENTEIIRLFRSVSVPPGELEDFLRSYRTDTARFIPADSYNNMEEVRNEEN